MTSLVVVGGGGAGGGILPNFDLSQMGKKPEWLQWIIDNKDLILSIMAGITAGLLAWKLGLGGIKALGIGVLIAGIAYAIQGLLSYLQSPTWKSFGKIIQGIGIAIIGLGIIVGSLPVAVVGAAVLILGTIVKYWDKIKAFFQNGIDWLTNKSDWVRQMFGDIIGNIYDMFVNELQQLLNIFDASFTSLKGMFDGVIKFIKGVFKGDWEMAWNGIKDIFESRWRGTVEVFNAIMNTISTRAVTIAKNTGIAIGSAFKAVINSVLRNIEMILNVPIGAINTLIQTANSLPGVNMRYLPRFSLPRLKVGGIVNMPNRGTLVGGAIAGESGREGVIPLTDSQAMETLGEAIGRYINLNATIPVYVGNRQIAREIKRINTENDFAFNS